MQDHAIGPLTGVRQGSQQVEQSYPFDFSEVTAVPKTLGTIKASTTEPVIVDGEIIIQVASDGTTHTLAVTIGGVAFVAATSIKTAPNTKTAGTTLILTANSDIVATPVITGVPTVGRTWVNIRPRVLNVDKRQK